MASHEKEAAHVHLTYMEQKIESQDRHIAGLDSIVQDLARYVIYIPVELSLSKYMYFKVKTFTSDI